MFMAAMSSERKEIAVIGGGLGGCLTALMLARLKDEAGNPRYHITLIEAQNTLLNGASAIASRLHLGGEYPRDSQTANDCLTGAVIWKLLMPDTIYTPAPAMKFLISKDSQREGENGSSRENGITLKEYSDAYEKIRQKYKKLFGDIKRAFGWDRNKTEKALFGSPEENKFFRPLARKEYSDYANIEGGFQSQEIGLNVPKYLAMLEIELETQKQKGNIEILTGHRVKKTGIRGKKGHFKVHCQNGTVIEADQVVQAAWSGGPEITPQLGQEGDRGNKVVVYKRGMLLVDLPEGWKTSPAFVMMGKYGGMLSTFNDKIAVCYLPVDGAAYRGEVELTNSEPSLPSNWNDLSASEKNYWAQDYFKRLKERFPILEKATNPRVVVQDTLNFQQRLSQRRHDQVHELMDEDAIKSPFIPLPLRGTIGIGLQQLQNQQMVHWHRPFLIEPRQGLFTLYPTKATYGVYAALQAAHMVEVRRLHPDDSRFTEPLEDTLQMILSKEGREKYSLKNMKEPSEEYYKKKFFPQHPELDPKMLLNTWPDKVAENTRGSWGDRMLERRQAPSNPSLPST